MNNWNISRRKNEYFGGYSLEISHNPNSGKEQPKFNNIVVKIFTGTIIGFVNGFWGGGGGMICVPLLMQVIKLPEKKAHATTLLIMLPLCIASLIVYFTNGNLPIKESTNIGIGFTIGGLFGAGLLKVISNMWLGIIFSIIIIAGGIKMLI